MRLNCVWEANTHAKKGRKIQHNEITWHPGGQLNRQPDFVAVDNLKVHLRVE